jgi:heme exporter protein D
VIGIHDPDVVFTDLGLALLGGYFAWRLRRGPSPGALLMAGLASAAFWGAVFHGFFPTGTASPSGFFVWLAVAVSILVVAAALLDMTILVLGARLTPGASRGITIARPAVISAYSLTFIAVLLLVDESFATIVWLYGPVLFVALAGAAFEAARSSSRAWALVALGLALSALAALSQRLGVALHATYFDHNAVYHVIQAAALVVLYAGFARRTSDAR